MLKASQWVSEHGHVARFRARTCQRMGAGNGPQRQLTRSVITVFIDRQNCRQNAHQFHRPNRNVGAILSSGTLLFCKTHVPPAQQSSSHRTKSNDTRNPGKREREISVGTHSKRSAATTYNVTLVLLSLFLYTASMLFYFFLPGQSFALIFHFRSTYLFPSQVAEALKMHNRTKSALL